MTLNEFTRAARPRPAVMDYVRAILVGLLAAGVVAYCLDAVSR